MNIAVTIYFLGYLYTFTKVSEHHSLSFRLKLEQQEFIHYLRNAHAHNILARKKCIRKLAMLP